MAITAKAMAISGVSGIKFTLISFPGIRLWLVLVTQAIHFSCYINASDF
jgi:hypothetical protein